MKIASDLRFSRRTAILSLAGVAAMVMLYGSAVMSGPSHQSVATQGTSDNALPAGSSNFPTSATTDGVMNLDNTTTTPAPVIAPTPEPVEATSCDVVRESLLTGTPAEIKAAMLQLKADKSADATAREYAAEYLTETNADLQRMNVSLLQMLCRS